MYTCIRVSDMVLTISELYHGGQFIGEENLGEKKH